MRAEAESAPLLDVLIFVPYKFFSRTFFVAGGGTFLHFRQVALKAYIYA